MLLQKGCANCHAPWNASPIGPDLSSSKAIQTPLALATAMWNHAPAMFSITESQNVEWPRFEGDEMRDLSAYLQTLPHTSRALPVPTRTAPSTPRGDR